MKTLFASTLLGLVFCSANFAQSPATADEPLAPYDMVDENIQPPTFPGGEQAMLHFLAQNIQYPTLARENGIQGIVALSFIVEKDGAISNVTILKDIGGGCGLESARVVKAMPNWKPGNFNGDPVRVRFTLPVRYKLEGNVRKKEKKKGWKDRGALIGQ